MVINNIRYWDEEEIEQRERERMHFPDNRTRGPVDRELGVMSEHQETLKQAVARIEASFAKIEIYGKKANDDFRISAGKQLVGLKARIDDGVGRQGCEVVAVVRRALRELLPARCSESYEAAR